MIRRISNWLKQNKHAWLALYLPIYLIGFFFGIGGGAVTAWKFGQSVLRHQKHIETEPDGKKKKKRVSFNRHI